MADKRINYEAAQKRAKRFVRPNEGAAIYNMGITKFTQLAKEANAIYKVDKIVLVNTEIFEKYLESFRVY